MTSGRKPVSPATPQGPDFVTETPTEVAAQQRQAQEIMRGEELVMQFEEPLRQLGRIDSFEFMRRVADVGLAQVFENLRNSGKYKGLPYKDAEGNVRHVADIVEFCELKLGKSYRRCMELSQNLRLLGPELYEQSERLGLRNIDYKALRALPEEEQKLVTEAIKENQSRDGVLEIMQELVSRHQHERETLKGEIATKDAETAKAHADVSGQLAAKDRLIADSKKRIADLVEEKNRLECMTDGERTDEIEQQLTRNTLIAVGALIPVRKSVHAARSLDHCPQGLYVAMQGALDRVIAEAMSIATDYGIQLNLTQWPDEGDLEDPNAGEVLDTIFPASE